MAFNGDWAGWELPRRWRGQGSVDRRAARQTHKTRRAWVFHTLEALKPQRTGERRCVRLGRGALGAAIHCRRPKLRGSGAGAEANNSLLTSHISSHGAQLHNSCVLLDPDAPFLPTYLT